MHGTLPQLLLGCMSATQTHQSPTVVAVLAAQLATHIAALFLMPGHCWSDTRLRDEKAALQQELQLLVYSDGQHHRWVQQREFDILKL